MTFQDDPSRLPPDAPLLQRGVPGRRVPDDTSGWAAPLAMTAVVLVIAGLLFFNSAGDRMTTASNTAATAPAQSTPSPNIGKTSPPPAKTQ